MALRLCSVIFIFFLRPMQGEVVASNAHTNYKAGGIETISVWFEERVDDHNDQPIRYPP